MNDRLPQTLRTRTHVEASARCIPTTPPRRVTVGPDALRAAYGAHMQTQHEGRRGLGCRTCRRYLEAVVAARARERTQAQP